MTVVSLSRLSTRQVKDLSYLSDGKLDSEVCLSTAVELSPQAVLDEEHAEKETAQKDSCNAKHLEVSCQLIINVTEASIGRRSNLD